MMVLLVRAALVIASCTGLSACSQQASQSVASDGSSQVSRPARLCIAEGQPGPVSHANPDSATWAITVSSEGGPCQHVREWGGTYVVLEPPRHGRITQEPQGGGTVVSYWPDRGYVGADRFALRYPPRNVALPYRVAVLP